MKDSTRTRKISRRQALRVAALGSAGLALARTTAPARAAGAKVELRVATYQVHEPGLSKVLNAIKAIVERKNPDIQVTYYGQPQAQYWNQLGTELASGNPPDLFDIAAMWFFGYSRLGSGYEPLDDYLKDTDILDPKLGINPGVRSIMTIDGKARGVPIFQSSFGFLYWKDRFAEAGVKPEDLVTWEGFHEAARKLTGKGKYAIAPATSGDFWGINEWERWSWTIGGGITPHDQPPYQSSNIGINNEGSIYAAEFMRKMMLDEKLSPGGVIDNPTQTNHFYSKRIAMTQGGSYQLQGVKAANPEAFKDLGLFRLPDCNWKGQKWQPTINIGWHVYVMPAGAKNKQAAAEWLKVLGSDEGQMLSYEVAGNEVAKLSVINKLPAESLQRQSATFNQSYRIVPPNTNPRKQEIWNGIAPLFQKMWLGQTSAKDTMEACQREVKRIMEKV